VQASKREEWVERFFQVMNEWNIYCSLSIIQVHAYACIHAKKKKKKKKKNNGGKDFQLMNEIFIAWRKYYGPPIRVCTN